MTLQALDEAAELYGDRLDRLNTIGTRALEINAEIANLNTEWNDLLEEVWKMFDDVEGADTAVRLLLSMGIVIERQKKRKAHSEELQVDEFLDELQTKYPALFVQSTSTVRVYDETKLDLVLRAGQSRSPAKRRDASIMAELIAKHTTPLEHTFARIVKEATKAERAELADNGHRFLRIVVSEESAAETA